MASAAPVESKRRKLRLEFTLALSSDILITVLDIPDSAADRKVGGKFVGENARVVLVIAKSTAKDSSKGAEAIAPFFVDRAGKAVKWRQ